MSKTPFEMQCLQSRESTLEATNCTERVIACQSGPPARARSMFVPTASGRVDNHG